MKRRSGTSRHLVRLREGGLRAAARRRRAVLRRLDRRTVALLPAAPTARRSRDVDYRYRQDSDFDYLTGFPEPEALAALAPGHPRGPFWLLVRPRDAERETWDGPRHGLKGAQQHFGADQALSIADQEAALEGLLARARTLLITRGVDPEWEQRLQRLMRRRRRAGLPVPDRIEDLRPLLHGMRLRKDDHEVQLMRQAAAISCRAHRSAMAAAAPGMLEYQLEAHVEASFRSQGATAPAYPSIVASGPNAVVLHHIRNDRRMRAGDMVLLDAGCEWQGYASDVTRTFPVDGRFRPAQRRLYEVVLAAQQAALDAVRPGVAMRTPHRAAVKVLCEGLSQLRLLPGSAAEIEESRAYARFYMHSTSHWLGRDVHDVGGGTQGAGRRLAGGMVLTVEPGLYVPPDAEDVPRAYRGLGVRIEDDVLVTAAGREVLTRSLPRRVAAVERACRKA